MVTVTGALVVDSPWLCSRHALHRVGPVWELRGVEAEDVAEQCPGRRADDLVDDRSPRDLELHGCYSVPAGRGGIERRVPLQGRAGEGTRTLVVGGMPSVRAAVAVWTDSSNR